MPLVDIIVSTNGYKAEDAIELVTRPLEDLIKSINGVEHVYSQTQDDNVVVTARFFVGTPQDNAVLRVHDKIRANILGLPKGIAEPLIIGRGIDDVAIVVLTLSAKPERAANWNDNGLFQVAEELRHDLAKVDNVGLTYIVGGQAQSDPRRARSREIVGIRNHSEPAGREAHQRQSLHGGRGLPGSKPIRFRRGGTNAPGRARHRPIAADLA